MHQSERIELVFEKDDAENAINAALEKLRSYMIGGKGFALACVVNHGDASANDTGVARVAGGTVSTEQLAKLCMETLIFSKEIANSPLTKQDGKQCDCPKCRAEREKEQQTSTIQ